VPDDDLDAHQGEGEHHDRLAHTRTPSTFPGHRSTPSQVETDPSLST
jgi:hypothetical protein